MDKKQAKELISNLFSQAFDRQRYEHFLRNLLNHFEPRSGHYSGNYIPDAYKDLVNQYWRIGKYVDPDGEELDLLVVEVKTLAKLERARSALRNFAVSRLKQFEKEASLIAFYAKDDGGQDWRFSFIKIEHEAYKDEKGKVKLKQELTPARRYSYLVGVHENSHTAAKQLLPLLTMDYADPRIEEIEAAFSVEQVSDEFFEQYKQLFLKLAAHLKTQSFFRRESDEETDRVVSRFSKKLLGQIVFLYFLQKKGWLGAPKDGKWGEGSKRFMRERFDLVAQNGGNYFHDFLEPLFYEALAREHKGGDDPDYYPRFDCKIPFLNGGLFEAEYDWQNETINLPNELFHNDEKNKAGDRGTGILDVFDRYNFTIKEDEPLEKEVAIDPEMLGKVFENMLEITERKKKGAFYTPREIVHYMCQESLVYYLEDALKNTVPREELETLIRKGHLALENDQRVLNKGKETGTYKFKLPESVRNHAREIDQALADVKICDPAIGSGAFPVGLLHEIVNARQALAPHSGNAMTAYDLKRHAIRESIYGVDIDASAIDIARLRLWLSMIVDEERYDTIEPLPNLDYKIVQGDSLLGIEVDLFNLELFNELEAKKKAFFDTTNREEKERLNKEIESLISKITNGKQLFDFKVYFSEVWHQKGGFDIVIGNPPYLRIQGIRESSPEKADFYKRLYSSATGSFDLYVLFLERGMELIHDSGVVNFIIPDKWINASFGKGIRKLVSEKQNVMRLISFGAHKIFSASTYSSLVWIGRKKMDSIQYMKMEPEKHSASLEMELELINDECFTPNSYSQLSELPWILLSGDHADVMRKLLNMKKKLKYFLDMFVGLQTSKDSVFFLRNAILNNGLYEADSPELGQRVRIEEGLAKPLLLGDQVHRYQPLQTTNIVIFPYLLKDGARPELMTEEYIAKHFPEGYTYLKACEDVLRGREKGKLENDPGWFRYIYPKNLTLFHKPKLIAPDISFGGNFAYDADGRYYTTTTLYGYIKKENVYENYEYWLGILNSTLLWYYLKNTGSVLANGYYRYKPAYLKEFPVPDVKQSEERNITQLVSYLLTVNAMPESKKLMANFFDQLIDALVYELYFPEEINAAGKEIMPYLDQLEPITNDMGEEEKLAVIQREFNRLYDPNHPVRNTIETLDSVNVVRTIREALKK